ncbi:sigma-54-dependent Fis family transcriptional regulator [Acinetobacter sp. ANC 4635]|uniref:sigma-54-dependent transcriptional regulator n=1 Tax=Acinetobacter sp. ANC 4635 TaxID=2529846 RepID=UPI001039A207|nr:sigma-54 dependent transcriptional regulator [Acinetobacter sp. ANC 4635]TCB27575.1 sigma-54-dependent Fis family transcriptional regulator [Acinetobacter sp. ANC 4635]
MTTQQPRVLLVDDEKDLCMLMQMSLKRIGIQAEVAYNITQAKQQLKAQRFDACLTDLNLPDGDGIQLVRHVTEYYPNTPIAVITAYGNMEIAIAALKAGAFDFVSKPVRSEDLQQLLEKAIIPNEDNSHLTASSAIEERMLIGSSEVIQQLKHTIRKISKTQAPVFITGESGTGKEVVANLIHSLSNRKNGPFVPINCGAIPVELMESELFGHKKGSFTNATQDKQGLIQAAHGGSLFLDEIAELPMNMQVKLLRAVQEKKIRPIGSDVEIAVDFRIISATHQNLEALIQQGKFRQDLFFRLHVMDIRLPPLRERGQDILELAHYFIQKICQEWQIPNKQLTLTAQQFLLEQRFSGNVRELRNIIERALTLSDSTVIDIQHIRYHSESRLSSQTSNPAPVKVPEPEVKPISHQSEILTPRQRFKLPEEGLEAYLESIEKNILLNALEMTHWNRTMAAKKLQMSFRSLRYRLKKFGLDIEGDEDS